MKQQSRATTSASTIADRATGAVTPGALERAAAYFGNRPFHRILSEMRARYEVLGRVGGAVRLSLTDEERRALRDFLGRGLRASGDGTVHLDLKRFDAALQRGAFACTLPELLEAYFGATIQTRPARRAARASRWQRLLEEMAAVAEGLADPLPRRWWEQVRGGRAQHSGAWIRRAFGSGGRSDEGSGNDSPAGVELEGGMGNQSLRQTIGLVLRALAALPGLEGRHEPLPVFAARLAGDPHAFDADRAAGRLLDRALLDALPGGAARVAGIDSASVRREVLLAAAGLARDDLSSTVLACGLLHALTAAGEPDPLVKGALEAWVPVAYPLRVVRRWARVEVSDPTFVVENPSVFGALLDAIQAARTDPDGAANHQGGSDRQWGWPLVEGLPTVICTAGQLSLAAYTLLDRLAEAGVQLLYSGDFDPAGLVIARGLKERYGERLKLWRMSTADYETALARAGEPVPIGERHHLTTLRSGAVAGTAEPVPEPAPELAALADRMESRGLKAFQEVLVPELCADLLQHRALGSLALWERL